MAVSSKTLQMPDFVRKTQSARYQPRDQLDPYHPLVAIYLMRLALGLKKIIPTNVLGELFNNNLGEITGLSEITVPGVNDADQDDFLFEEMERNTLAKATRPHLLKHIRDQLKRKMAEGMQVNAPLFNTLKLLADNFNLTATDQEILAVRLLMKQKPEFNAFLNRCYCGSETSFVDYFHILTTRPINDIEKSLADTGLLYQLGWIEITSKAADLENAIKLPPSLADVLLCQHESPEALLKHFFKQCQPSTVKQEDYTDLKDDLAVIIPYLQAALQTRQAGVNLLIHGAPGTGKNELAKLLAQNSGARLFKVNRSTDNAMFFFEHDRFAACKLTQHWLLKQSQPSIIVIDEAEKIFPHQQMPLFFEDDDDDISGIDPALLNQQLENNPLPIIWIVNKTKNIETAFLKRFDYSLQVDKMPLTLRSQYIANATQKLSISAAWCAQLAQHTDITLEQIDKAAAIAKLSRHNTDIRAEDIMERVLNAGIRLLKQSTALKQTQHATGYHLMFTNTSIPLAELVAGLQNSPRGNFCFYGAPGTGKTAFAKHIAEQLGLPILIKRASDILGKYVGQSEKNIARMFDQAQRQGAILLLDEADSLLGDRRDARQRWEVSQVNEMLAQMERYSGLFICTTNLMDKLDAASLRRFDFKVKFDYLKAEQRWALFQQESQRLGVNLPEESDTLAELKQQIQRLTKLTPGDFTVLNRQAVLLGKPMVPADMVAVLEQECLAKGESFARMGFVH